MMEHSGAIILQEPPEIENARMHDAPKIYLKYKF